MPRFRLPHRAYGELVTTNWFYKKTLTDEFYCFVSPTRSEYKLIGDGKILPTPVEIKVALETYPDFMYDKDVGFLLKKTEELPILKPVVLPFGVYKFQTDDYPLPERLVPFDIRKDKIIHLPQFYDEIDHDVNSFLQGEKIYREIGIPYKRGWLFYGPPGQGKTSIIRSLIRNKFQDNAIVIFMSKMPSFEFLKMLGQDKRMKVLIFEELVSMLQDASDLDMMLNFLDGEFTIDNCIAIATTNYPEKLPGNLVDRPSRFDRIIKIDKLNPETKHHVLSFYLGREAKEEEVKLIEDLSLAAIREAAILSRVRSIAIADTIKLMQKHKALAKKEFSESNSIGFSYD